MMVVEKIQQGLKPKNLMVGSLAVGVAAVQVVIVEFLPQGS